MLLELSAGLFRTDDTVGVSGEEPDTLTGTGRISDFEDRAEGTKFAVHPDLVVHHGSSRREGGTRSRAV